MKIEKIEDKTRIVLDSAYVTLNEQEFVEFMERKGAKLHILHTSGHADSITIDKLIKIVKPKRIIPVHTENAKWFDKYKDICL